MQSIGQLNIGGREGQRGKIIGWFYIGGCCALARNCGDGYKKRAPDGFAIIGALSLLITYG
ncbi:hypothetical protein J41TS4_02920 [Paenibacillus apis]|uniref:Uncharacterized protein n=1 Tax=Paenibacillus apis TaxID=1792174 RepID=A0A919XX15_9BACL|nr:hypothetical protein J41TS4_02920 [Paenibacillus apis]